MRRASRNAHSPRPRDVHLALVKGQRRRSRRRPADVPRARQRHAARRHDPMTPRVHIAIGGENHGVTFCRRQQHEILALHSQISSVAADHLALKGLHICRATQGHEVCGHERPKQLV